MQVGVYLPRYVSDHGKLYVALSRVRRQTDVKLLILNDYRQGFHEGIGEWFTPNPVKQQLWNLALDREQPDPEANYNVPVYIADAQAFFTCVYGHMKLLIFSGEHYGIPSGTG